MKALSYGFVFDTETATLVAKHEDENHGILCIYLTKFGRYFSHYQPSKSQIEEGETEMITYLQEGVEELDDLIDELNSEFDNKVEVYLEHFQLG